MEIPHRIELYQSAGVYEIQPRRDIRLLYLVGGEATCSLDSRCEILGRRDVLLAGSGQTLQLTLPHNVFAAVVTTQYDALCEALGVVGLVFDMDATGDIQAQMQKLLMAYIQPGADMALTGEYYLLLHALLAHSRPQPEESDSVVSRMLRYIYTNYRHELSLGEIAQQLYVSPSWASRQFQAETGQNFVSFVRNLRLERVCEQLASTDLPVTQIATESGFHTPAALYKAFQAAYACTPADYRETHRQVPPALEQVSRLLASELGQEGEQPVTVQADVSQCAPWRRWEARVLNVGPAHTLASASLQRQVLFLAEELSVEYVRIWNVFAPGLQVLDERQRTCNFSFLDEILDFCVDQKLALWIDLAQRRDVAMASEHEEIYSSEACTVFHTAAHFQSALRQFLRHVRERYGAQIVGRWVFEFTFFLNDQPYYLADDYAMLRVWELGYTMVRLELPRARIAGPGIFGFESAVPVIQMFLQSPCVPDIFTSMHFPYTGEIRLGAESIYKQAYQKLPNHHFLEEGVARIQAALRDAGFTGEHVVTDWGSSIANRNYIQDSCYRAACMAEHILQCCEQVAGLGIFYASDLISRFSDTHAVLSGSAGIVSRDGICKPAFYACQFLTHLLRYCVQRTEHCMVTTDRQGKVAILCYHCLALGSRYYLSEENSHRPEDIASLFDRPSPLSLTLQLALPGAEGTCAVRQDILHPQQGSVLDKWLDFGCSVQLDRSDIAYLRSTCVPERQIQRVAAIDHTLTLHLCLQPHEIRLIRLAY